MAGDKAEAQPFPPQGGLGAGLGLGLTLGSTGTISVLLSLPPGAILNFISFNLIFILYWIIVGLQCHVQM